MTARLTIVDDDPAFTDFLQTLLKTRGYAVDVFHRGAELLEALRAVLPRM
jgi:DNA-binding response OmpR family regulator